MDYAALREQFHDVAFTTATPFRDDGDSVDHDALRENLDAMVDADASVFIPCGNTGEYYALSIDERKAVVATHADHLPDDTTIVAGAGGPIPQVMDLATAYERAGADVLMLMHPSHAFAHERGLVEYYERIARSTDLGVAVYKRGPGITRDVIASVAEIENVVAVKFAVNDVGEFTGTMAETDGDVAWVNGIAERFAVPFHVAGADGYTTGVGNFAPETTLALYEALETGEYDRAAELQEAIRPFEELRAEAGKDNVIEAANNVPAIKHGLDAVGLHGGPVRPPLVELDDATVERATAALSRLRAIE